MQACTPAGPPTVVDPPTDIATTSAGPAVASPESAAAAETLQRPISLLLPSAPTPAPTVLSAERTMDEMPLISENEVQAAPAPGGGDDVTEVRGDVGTEAVAARRRGGTAEAEAARVGRGAPGRPQAPVAHAHSSARSAAVFPAQGASQRTGTPRERRIGSSACRAVVSGVLCEWASGRKQ